MPGEFPPWQVDPTTPAPRPHLQDVLAPIAGMARWQASPVSWRGGRYQSAARTLPPRRRPVRPASSQPQWPTARGENVFGGASARGL
nr:hypothetical protein JVH1_4749 [Rhodococcus sp. JVH1]